MTTKKAPIKKARPKVATKVVEEAPRPKRVPVAIQRKAKRFEELKAEEKLIKAEVSELQGELIEYMDTEGEKTFTVGTRDFTRVQGESVVIDEEKLKKLIGATTYNKLLVKVLDKAKLDQAVKDKLVTTTQIAQVSTIKQNKPYISLSK